MAGLSWFKFWVNAHEGPKVAALSDSEFRLLTYLWCLAQRATEPGKVQIAPGIGVPAEQLVRRAGCTVDWNDPSTPDPSDMLRTLERFRLIDVDAAGVITIHDWEEWNGRPESKQPDYQAAYKREYRKQKACPKDVRSLSEQSPKTEVEEEEEVETTTTPPAGAGVLDELRRRIQVATGSTKDYPVARGDGGYVRGVREKLVAELERVGLERGLTACAKAANDAGGIRVLEFCLPVLAKMSRPAAPLREIVGMAPNGDYVWVEGTP